MKCVGYIRSIHPDDEAVLREYASNKKIELLDVLSDENDEYGSFRILQSLIKMKLCDTVLLVSYDALGEDRYIRLENKLFIERNGAKLMCIRRQHCDGRHDIAVAVSRFFSLLTEYDTEYGSILPIRNTRKSFLRKPPFGYEVVKGGVRINQEEASIVRGVFSAYIEGKRIKDICTQANAAAGSSSRVIGNMTVKTLLKNERYLGRLSKKGYHLPSLIRYETWLKAHERLEREYPPFVENESYIGKILTDKPSEFCRCPVESYAPRRRCGYIINSSILEKCVEQMLKEHYTNENAKAFFCEYVLKEKETAEAAYKKAAIEYNRIVQRFEAGLAELVDGDYTDLRQRELERIADIKNVYGMRVRRIESERRLFSVSCKQIEEFFERVCNMQRLSIEEKGFIADALVKGIRIKDGTVRVHIKTPLKPTVEKSDIEGAIHIC